METHLYQQFFFLFLFSIFPNVLYHIEIFKIKFEKEVINSLLQFLLILFCGDNYSKTFSRILPIGFRIFFLNHISLLCELKVSILMILYNGNSRYFKFSNRCVIFLMRFLLLLSNSFHFYETIYYQYFVFFKIPKVLGYFVSIDDFIFDR